MENKENINEVISFMSGNKKNMENKLNQANELLKNEEDESFNLLKSDSNFLMIILILIIWIKKNLIIQMKLIIKNLQII